MLNSLRQIVQEVNAASDLDDVLDIIVRRVQTTMEITHFQVGKPETGRGNYQCPAAGKLSRPAAHVGTNPTNFATLVAPRHLRKRQNHR